MNAIAKLLFDITRKVFLDEYIKHYIKISGVSMPGINSWIPLLAAAYLEEGMTHKEEKRLLRLVADFGDY